MDILKGLHKEFGWFIWGLVGIGFLWFFSGGPEREVAHQGAYLKPLEPIDSGQGYGKYYFGTETNQKQTLDLPENPSDVLKKAENALDNFFTLSQEAKQIHNTSLLSKTISFDGIAGAKNTKVSEEYIRILASEYAKTPIKISGLTLRGYTLGINTPIPQATDLLILGVSSTKSDVVVPPKGRVLISSGRSPIGTSFRVNMCTGYLDQFQIYTPSLFKDCPYPKDELERFGPKDDASCVEFVEKLPRCKIYQGSFPSNLSASCKNFVTEKLNYNSCALDHRYDANFFADEWRLFLDKQTELWSAKNEVIRLIDLKGNVIDAITY